MTDLFAFFSRFPGAFLLAFGVCLAATVSSHLFGSFAGVWAVAGLYAGANLIRASQGLQ